jgi:hypothetical protein
LPDRLFRQPAPRLLRFVRRKKLHRRVTDPRSRKSECEGSQRGSATMAILEILLLCTKRKSRSFPQSPPRSHPSKFSRMTSKRGFDPMSILRARAFCSAPNSDRFKIPLMRNAQMPSGSYFHFHWHGRMFMCLVLLRTPGLPFGLKSQSLNSV